MRRQGEPGVTIPPRKHEQIPGGLLSSAVAVSRSSGIIEHYLWDCTRYRLLRRTSNVIACSTHKPEVLTAVVCGCMILKIVMYENTHGVYKGKGHGRSSSVVAAGGRLGIHRLLLDAAIR